MALSIRFYVVTWIFLSCVMTLLNKAILTGWGFKFPIFLTAWHSIFSTILTQILSRTTKMLPGVSEVKIDMLTFRNKILPIAGLFSLSIMTSNKSVQYLSISYIQMLKAFSPVLVLILGFFIGIENPTQIHLVIVLMISLGVSISCVGELKFSLIGFVCQCCSLVCEVSRVALSERLLKGMKLDSLSMLYYQAPISFLFIGMAFIIFELDSFPYAIIGDPFLLVMLFLSAVSAFALNVSVVLLLTNANCITLSLAGIVKDILLVGLSIIIFNSPVTYIQIVGFSISLVGIYLYKESRSGHNSDTDNVFLKNMNFLGFKTTSKGVLTLDNNSTCSGGYDVTNNIKAIEK